MKEAEVLMMSKSACSKTAAWDFIFIPVYATKRSRRECTPVIDASRHHVIQMQAAVNAKLVMSVGFSGGY